MNENQRKQIEAARREAHAKSDNVCADGQKHDLEPVCNQINNE